MKQYERLTSIAGPPDRTIMVITNVTKQGVQEGLPSGFLPLGWIQARW